MKRGTSGFVGERLTEAREARGVTAAALADMIGVTPAAVSQYERGHQTPAPAVMRLICSCLNLPLTFFLKEEPSVPVQAIFFRSMKSTTKGSRQRAQRRFRWLRQMVVFIEGYIEFPSLNLPDLGIHGEISKLTPSRIEAAATELRRYWGLGDGPISNVTWLLENNGIVVTRFELGEECIDAFSDFGINARPCVVLNADRVSALRSRFDICHELGHLMLHRALSESDIQDKQTFDLIEKQAHRFAAAFLLPRATFGRQARFLSVDKLVELAPIWKVSAAAMLHRIEELNLVSEEISSRMWMAMSKRGLRKRDPGDDIVAPERPQLLSKAIQVITSSGIMSSADIVFQFSLSAHDIEQILGLDAGALSGDEDIEMRLKSPTLPFPRIAN